MATLRNIERLIRVLRDDHLAVNGEMVGFNMGTYVASAETTPDLDDHFGAGCQTVACIAGHCYLMATGDRIEQAVEADGEDIETVARDFLGIDAEQASLLFYDLPDGWVLGEVTPAQAISTLERLAATGKVVWQ